MHTHVAHTQKSEDNLGCWSLRPPGVRQALWLVRDPSLSDPNLITEAGLQTHRTVPGFMCDLRVQIQGLSLLATSFTP